MTNTLAPNPRRLRFVRRPSPVLPEHRPLYKIGQVLLVLHLCCRGGKASLPKLHLFNWALKTTARQKLMLDAASTKQLTVPAWGFDPVLAIGIRFAIAEGLIRETGKGYEIVETGEIFLKELLKDSDLFAAERKFLSSVGKDVTEAMVEAAAKSWEIA